MPSRRSADLVCLLSHRVICAGDERARVLIPGGHVSYVLSSSLRRSKYLGSGDVPGIRVASGVDRVHRRITHEVVLSEVQGQLREDLGRSLSVCGLTESPSLSIH